MAASESEIHTTVCVIGAGLMGSSTAYAAASRINNSHDKQADAANKSSVLVLEQYSLLHRQGSSHGESRIVRKAYPQDYYSAMMKSAWGMWTEVQEKSGTNVYTHTKELAIGKKDSTAIWRLIESCKSNKLQYEILTPSKAMEMFPGLQLPEDYIAVLQEDAGVLHATKSVMMMQNLAKSEGAQFYENEEVVDIIPLSSKCVKVQTNKGKTIIADKVVVTAGAWTKKLLERASRDMQVSLDPTHITVSYWPVKDPNMYKAKDKWPVLIDYSKTFSESAMPGPQSIPGHANGMSCYLIPQLEYTGLVKVSAHGGPLVEDPSNLNMVPGFAEIENYVKPWIGKYLPYVDNEQCAIAEPCLYTMSPNSDFLLDAMPHPFENVVVGGGFSGHGFKFGPLIGEILTDIALEGSHNRHDMSHFSFSKLMTQSTRPEQKANAI